MIIDLIAIGAGTITVAMIYTLVFIFVSEVQNPERRDGKKA